MKLSVAFVLKARIEMLCIDHIEIFCFHDTAMSAIVTNGSDIRIEKNPFSVMRTSIKLWLDWNEVMEKHKTLGL